MTAAEYYSKFQYISKNDINKLLKRKNADFFVQFIYLKEINKENNVLYEQKFIYHKFCTQLLHDFPSSLSSRQITYSFLHYFPKLDMYWELVYHYDGNRFINLVYFETQYNCVNIQMNLIPIINDLHHDLDYTDFISNFDHVCHYNQYFDNLDFSLLYPSYLQFKKLIQPYLILIDLVD